MRANNDVVYVLGLDPKAGDRYFIYRPGRTLKSLAAQLGGLKESEQHFDQHPALVLHPRQNHRPPSI